MQNKEVINAFRKDYVKTCEPDLMKEFRTHAANREDREEKNLKTGHKPLKTLSRSTIEGRSGSPSRARPPASRSP